MSIHEIDKKRRMDGTKLFWHNGRVYDRFVNKKRVAPIHIDMGIAKFCNIACVFCYGKYQISSKEYIQRDQLLQSITDAAEIGVKSVGFIGDGEPTCNPYVWEALKLGKEKGLDMSISTSGVLIDNDEKRDAVLRSCTWMRFCFSAGTREGYKLIHGKDYFDKVVKNIRDLVDYKKKNSLSCEIGMQAVFVPTLMLEEMVEESKLAVDLGVDYLVIKQCSLPDDGKSGMSYFDINKYDDEDVKSTLMICQNLSTQNTEIIPKWNLIAQKGIKNYDYCPSISLISEISGNGDWYPCGYMFGGKPQFEKYKFGNLHEKSLKEIWESDRYWSIIDIMENEFCNKIECKGCCRQDKCNEWVYNYRSTPDFIKKEMLHTIDSTKPFGINFI